jgi:hypothetical protein
MEPAWNGKEGKERTLRDEQFTAPADQGLFRWWVKAMKLPQIPGEREKRRRRRTVLVLVVLMLASVRRNQALRASLPLVRSVEEPPKLSYALSIPPSLSLSSKPVRWKMKKMTRYIWTGGDKSSAIERVSVSTRVGVCVGSRWWLDCG